MNVFTSAANHPKNAWNNIFSCFLKCLIRVSSIYGSIDEWHCWYLQQMFIEKDVDWVRTSLFNFKFVLVNIELIMLKIMGAKVHIMHFVPSGSLTLLLMTIPRRQSLFHVWGKLLQIISEGWKQLILQETLASIAAGIHWQGIIDVFVLLDFFLLCYLHIMM